MTTKVVTGAVKRTNLGPLTTAWPVPTECLTAIRQCDDCQFGFLAQACGNSVGYSDNVDCWPPRAASVSTKLPLSNWGYYSPGLECPRGYTAACSATAGDDTANMAEQFTLLSGETATGCCPTGFTCGMGGSGQTCIMKATSTSVVFPTATCKGGSTVSLADVTVTLGGELFERWAPLIQLNHQPSDLPSTSSSSATSSAASTRGSSTQALPTTRPSAGVAIPSDSSSSSGGLGTGAKAGLGVGVAAAVLLIAGFIFFLLCRRRGSKNAVPQEMSGESRYPPNSTAEQSPMSHASAMADASTISDTSAKAWQPSVIIPGPAHHTTSMTASTSKVLPVELPSYQQRSELA